MSTAINSQMDLSQAANDLKEVAEDKPFQCTIHRTDHSEFWKVVSVTGSQKEFASGYVDLIDKREYDRVCDKLKLLENNNG